MAKADSTTGTKRPRKSAAERAQADYDAAVKTRDVAQRKLTKLQEGVAPAQEAFDAAERRVAYLGQNPDLPSGVGQQTVQEPSDV
jgi:hypothetical protein